VDARLKDAGGKAAPISDVAPILQQAVVATEDERFYRHHGIDLIGVLRALPYDLVHLSLAQGASTITEQVAKLLYLQGNDHTPWRKLEDAAVALKLEDRYSKEQILDAYLNSAYFGEGAYGVWAASERYFGLPPRRLDVAQATLLAGLIQAPSAYDPLRHPLLARDRQIDVLRSLVRNGSLTQAEAAATLGRPLRLRAGSALPAVRGIDLAPGPAFIWWQLALGATLALIGGALLLLSRRPRLRPVRALLVVRALAILAVVLGLAEVVRSFRSA
jgi:membrane peptidoglycan carboxypeptidase